MKWNFAISGCCLLLLSANIALLRQNSRLKAGLALPPPGLEASAGAQMPDLRGFDLEGKPVEVLYGKDSRKVLVLVFSPTCPFCDQNWAGWQRMISSLDRSAVRPVAVDVTSTANSDFIALHQLAGLPVLLKTDPRATLDYRFQLTPQTILVGPAGKVEKVWSGVLNDSTLAEIQRRASGSSAARSAVGNRLGSLTKKEHRTMSAKIAKPMLFAAIVTSVLCAGTVSARQLQRGVRGSLTCGGRCSFTQPCATAGCFCSFSTPETGFCTTRPAGFVPSGK